MNLENVRRRVLECVGINILHQIFSEDMLSLERFFEKSPALLWYWADEWVLGNPISGFTFKSTL